MSDNSNSTGSSSGSSTNSWTLLSPEVRHPSRLGTVLPALFHHKGDLEDFFLRHLLEMHRVSACHSCVPTMMVLFKTWIIQLQFKCVNCVYSQKARGTYLSFFVIHYVFCGLNTVQMFSHCVFYTYLKWLPWSVDQHCNSFLRSLQTEGKFVFLKAMFTFCFSNTFSQPIKCRVYTIENITWILCKCK